MDLTRTILWAFPQAQFTVYGNSYEPFQDEGGIEYPGLVWLSEDIPKPTFEELESLESQRLEAENIIKLPPTSTITPNYRGLKEGLKQTSIFAKAFNGNSNALLLLMSEINSPHPDLDNFMYAINILRTTLTEDSAFTPEEEIFFQELLVENNFPVF